MLTLEKCPWPLFETGVPWIDINRPARANGMPERDSMEFKPVNATTMRVSAVRFYELTELNNENHFKMAGWIFKLKKPLYVSRQLSSEYSVQMAIGVAAYVILYSSIFRYKVVRPIFSRRAAAILFPSV